MIAALEAKLAEAKAEDRKKVQIKNLHDKRKTLVEREQKIAAQILEVDEQIAELVDADNVQLTFSEAKAEEV
jgi:ABC-type Zn2+ transport system substrate-binding protein/surface adhesin